MDADPEEPRFDYNKPESTGPSDSIDQQRVRRAYIHLTATDHGNQMSFNKATKTEGEGGSQTPSSCRTCLWTTLKLVQRCPVRHTRRFTCMVSCI